MALGAPVTVTPPLTHFLPVRLEQDDWGRAWAMPAPTNGSGDFTALAGTDGVRRAAARPQYLSQRAS